MATHMPHYLHLRSPTATGGDGEASASKVSSLDFFCSRLVLLSLLSLTVLSLIKPHVLDVRHTVAFSPHRTTKIFYASRPAMITRQKFLSLAEQLAFQEGNQIIGLLWFKTLRGLPSRLVSHDFLNDFCGNLAALDGGRAPSLSIHTTPTSKITSIPSHQPFKHQIYVSLSSFWGRQIDSGIGFGHPSSPPSGFEVSFLSREQHNILSTFL